MKSWVVSCGMNWRGSLRGRRAKLIFRPVQKQQLRQKKLQEENGLADVTSESKNTISSTDASENLRFYPPGRILHIVSVPSSDAADVDDGSNDEHVGIYETPRELYRKIRLSRKMINDHYMPMYEKMMELLISEVEKDEMYSYEVLQD
ncbi:hypothetical protein CRYUN_Cryun36dG0096900 [Craigia yunnanensis]